MDLLSDCPPITRQESAKLWSAILFAAVVQAVAIATIIVFAVLFWPKGVRADEPVTGFMTWYSEESARREGTCRSTHCYNADGTVFDETAATIALPDRQFGHRYQICRADAQPHRCLIARHRDFGPGHRARQQGVVVDATPYIYDALGCQRGINSRGIAWGRCRVTVARVR